MRKIIVLLLAFALVGCAADKEPVKKNTSACGDEESSTCSIDDGESADMSAYEDFKNKDNQFVTSNMEDVLKMIDKKESGVVYFGFPKCPWCIEALPILDEAAKENNLHILYVQTRDDDKKMMFSDEQKAEIMKHTDAYLQSDEEGNKQFYVPFVVVIRDGKVMDGHIGTVDGYDTKERKMNDDEKQQLKDVYMKMFETFKK